MKYLLIVIAILLGLYLLHTSLTYGEIRYCKAVVSGDTNNHDIRYCVTVLKHHNVKF